MNEVPLDTLSFGEQSEFSEPEPTSLAFQSAKVLASGRVLRVMFSVRPQPASHGLPDYLPAWQANQKLTLSNGGVCEPIGRISVNWHTYGALYQFVTNAASTIPVGRYWFRLMIADGSGNEVTAFDLTGGFGSTQHFGVDFNQAGKDIQFKFPAIPIGHTGRLYANTETGTNKGAEHTLGLLVSGIAAGATTHTISQVTTFVNASQRPDLPRTWIGYWLIPAASIVKYGDTVTFDAPAGLLADEFGNQTGAIDDGAIQNLSMMDVNGFCTEDFALVGSGAKTLYVAPAPYGNDANDGLTPATAKADLVTAWNTLPNRSGSHVKLLRGQTFPMTASLGSRFGVTGERTKPLVLESYYHDYGQGADPGTRPIILHSGYVCNYHAGMTDYFENWVIRDVHFKGNNPTTGGVIGPNWVISATNILWTNCIFEGSQCGVGAAGTYYETTNATIHRCIIKDNWKAGGNYQGIYTAGVRGLHVAECVVDRCGWKDAEFTERSIFDHNAYLQVNAHETITWNLWTSRAGAVGYQQRGGGCMAHVIFFDNPFQQNFVRFGASPYKCVVTDSILDGAGITTAEHYVETQAIGGSIDFSIAVNTTSTGGSALNQRNADDYSNEYRQRFLYTAARHNTVINHGVSAVFGNGPFVGYCRLHNNVLRNTNAARNAADVTLTDGNNTNWIDSDNNVWDIANPTGFWINNQGVITSNSFATWQALGRDLNSIMTSVTVVNPAYGLANHSQAEGGPSTKADFLTALRTRGRTTWSDLYSAQAAYDNFAAAYAPTNLPTIDLSPDGYYGHYDYRSGLPVLFTLTGPDELDLDEAGPFTITPSGAPDDTVDLSDDGVPAGTFTPSSITWTGTAQDARSFTYTPHDEGLRTISAEIDGGTVAIKNVSITGGEEPEPPTGVLISSVNWRW